MIFVDWITSFSVIVAPTVLGTVNDWVVVVVVVIKVFTEVVEEVALVVIVVVIEVKVLAVVEVDVELDAVVVVIVGVNILVDVVLDLIVIVDVVVGADLVVADTDGFTVGSLVTVVTFVVCVVDLAVVAGFESNRSTGTISKSSVLKLSSDSVSLISSSWFFMQVKRPGKLIHSHLSGQL